MSLLLAAAATVSAGQSFTCTPARVWDGDGPLWCAEGLCIRLTGIATREIDGTCREGQPCPHATAEQARDALVQLVVLASIFDTDLIFDAPGVCAVRALRLEPFGFSPIKAKVADHVAALARCQLDAPWFQTGKPGVP